MHINTIRIRYSDDTCLIDFNHIQDSLKCDSEVLEDIFAEWNHGSGRESSRFLDENVRSLSVGDYVSVDGLWYRCEGIGWKEKTKDEVNKWFDTMLSIRSKRNAGKTSSDERLARWGDKRMAERLLGIEA